MEKKYSLIVFDLDGTLARLGKGICQEHVSYMRQLEKQGYRIAVCSGKPTYYLCGFMRQVELAEPVLVGENGAVIQFGVDLPPRQFYKLPYNAQADQSLKQIRRAIDRMYPDMWYQPNEVALTPFPKTEKEFSDIQEYLDKNSQELKGIDIYRHCDTFDIVPTGLDKKQGILYLCRLLGLTADEVIAVGDGVNDYPMFSCAGLSLGVQVADADRVDHNFEHIGEVLEFLLSRRP